MAVSPEIGPALVDDFAGGGAQTCAPLRPGDPFGTLRSPRDAFQPLPGADERPETVPLQAPRDLQPDALRQLALIESRRCPGAAQSNEVVSTTPTSEWAGNSSLVRTLRIQPSSLCRGRTATTSPTEIDDPHACYHRRRGTATSRGRNTAVSTVEKAARA